MHPKGPLPKNLRDVTFGATPGISDRSRGWSFFSLSDEPPWKSTRDTLSNLASIRVPGRQLVVAETVKGRGGVMWTYRQRAVSGCITMTVQRGPRKEA